MNLFSYPYPLFALLIMAIIQCYSVADAMSNVVMAIQSGDNPVGVFYLGNHIPNHNYYKDTKPERLMRVIQAIDVGFEQLPISTSLILKSSDFKTRVLVTVEANNDKINNNKYPYILSFTNLAFGDREGDLPIELKHSESGFIWIEPSHTVSHLTDGNQPFSIRDGDKNTIFTVVLELPMRTEF